MNHSHVPSTEIEIPPIYPANKHQKEKKMKGKKSGKGII
jgi:hypothetical protein